MKQITIKIDEIKLINFEPYVSNTQTHRKFQFSAIFKFKGQEQLIAHYFDITFEDEKTFSWNDCHCNIKHGHYGMNKVFSEQIALGIVALLRKHKKRIYNLKPMNIISFTNSK